MAADEELEGGPEAVSSEVFKPYVCQVAAIRARGSLPHAGDIAEPASLSAIPLPPSAYPLFQALPPAVVQEGRLSQLQLEGVLYACTRHQQILPSGERAGFFIGDGAGVGKGRQIAGVVLDNYARGRRRHLWLSTSTDLHVDATRDMRDLGAHIPVINGCASLDSGTRALGLDKDLREGVLFLTYSTLISAGKAGRSRLTQVLEWLVGGTNTATTPSGGSGSSSNAAAAALAAATARWDGVLVFDECHKAKNFSPGKEAQSTKVASAVIELQSLLPNARVLYCSATGVSEVGNMAYMARMGLWGPSSPFPDFAAFLDSMKKRGVSFMELLAMEMKAAGRYVARGLSFREAEFLQVEAPLSPAKVVQYDAAVRLWADLRRQLDTALALTGGGTGGGTGNVWKTFWAAQQRFFKLLCIDLKLDAVLAESKAALASGMSVVIGLQSTGEAASDAMGLEPGPLPGFVSPCKELLTRLINQHFPVHQPQSAEAAAAGLQPEAVPACQIMRRKLLAQVAALQLPPNFLDVLIDELGGPAQVAEMTGRKGRVVRRARPGARSNNTNPNTSGSGSGAGPSGSAAGRTQVVFELRAKPDSSEMDSLNVAERDAFMCGKKLVALISDAASTGISLHAVATALTAHRRRLHLTVELPWSADKAIQQFGRSHRTNQLSAPLYKLVVSAAGGERRFAAAVARRLQSLGALTRGDRRAAAGLDLSESNFDSPWGRKSLRRMYDAILCEAPQLPAGVTVAALLKDLLPPAAPPAAGEAPAAAAAAPEAAADGAAGSTPQQQQQQQQAEEALRLLQAEIPALPLLRRLATQEAAAMGRTAAAAAGAGAGAAGAVGAGGSSNVTAAAAAAAAAQPSPAVAATPGGSDDEEAKIVAALMGQSPPPSQPAAAAAGGASSNSLASSQQRQQGQQQQGPLAGSAGGRALMTDAEVAAAISELHHELRRCCDLMDIGLGSNPRQNDTVAEDRPKDAGIASASKATRDAGDVRRFLNRLLGLPLGRQNLLFNYFAATLAAEIAAARAEGRYSEGVSDLQGSSIWRAAPPQLLWGAAGSGNGAAAAAAAAAGGAGTADDAAGDGGDALGTWVHTLVVDRGVSFEDAAKRLAHEAGAGSASGFRRSRRAIWGGHVVLLALQKPGSRNAFTIVRPNTGEAWFDMERSDMDAKYVRVTPEAAEEEWRAAHISSLTSCMHGAACANRGHCKVGSRLSEVTILSGAVVRVWGTLETLLDRHANELPRGERAMRVVRVAYLEHKPASAEPPQEQQPRDQQPQGSQEQQQQQGSQERPPEASQQQRGLQASQEQQQQQQGSQERQQGSQEQQQQPQASQHTPSQQQGRQVAGSSLSKAISPGSTAAAAPAPAAAAATTLSLVGVRYPAHLLPEVVATLTSLQEHAATTAAIAAALQKQQQQRTLPAAWGGMQAPAQHTQQPSQALQMSGWLQAALAAKGSAGAGLKPGGTQQLQQQPAAAAAAAIAAAAAAGALHEALGIARVEPPTPVDPKLLERAYKAPKTIYSFFQPAASAPAAAGAAAPAAAAAEGGGRRDSSGSAASGPVGASKGSSNPVLSCFSRMAAKQQQQAQVTPHKQQQQQQGLAQKQQQQAGAQRKRQQQGLNKAAALPPAKRPKQQQQQKQKQQHEHSASIICVDSSSSDSDFRVEEPVAAASAGKQQQRGAVVGGAGRPQRAAAATARAKVASPASAAAEAAPPAAAAAAGQDDAAAGSPVQDAAAAAAAGGSGVGSGSDSPVQLLPAELCNMEEEDEPNADNAGSASDDDDGDDAGDQDYVMAAADADDEEEEEHTGSVPPHQQLDGAAPVAAAQPAPPAPAAAAAQHRGGSGPGPGSAQQQQQQLVTAEKLSLLEGMGFTGRRAERALWVAQGNLERAIEFCLSR